MIKIVKDDDKVILKYLPYNGDDKWIKEAIDEKHEDISILKRYNFSYKDYLGKDEDDNNLFCLAILKDNYYYVRKDILETSFDVFLDKKYPIALNTFELVLKDKNCFNAIDLFWNKEKLYIGGPNEDIPSEDFQEIINNFPNYYERDLYVKSRIENILGSYFNIDTSFSEKLSKYVIKKEKKENAPIFNKIENYDIEKYELILEHLKKMIQNHSLYVEKKWQNEILKIITLIMPQYIFTLDSVSIRVNPKKRKQIDIVLVNANGNIDIIEIKRYDYGNLIGKSPDSRGNYKPSSNLSSAIVQAEKYAFLCNAYKEKVINEVEKKIKKKYGMDFKVNIINPKTLVIIGNSQNMNNEQKEDFELIRRMYTNVIDIITYEDLTNRLKNVIQALKNNN